jgi:deoxyribodipyrimidine photolyase-related protein
MSNYCADCRYVPSERTGEDACPFTTLYWDFLMRHKERLGQNRRMGLQLYNLGKIDDKEQQAIRSHAAQIRNNMTAH